ncbi:MAG: hypothetical protein SFU25_00265 [Candidatus Caenarcaniphilales bacterium]|nr:hypothetical protein [Candidatus Caenarcaniphilales bacterium]
MKVTPLQLNSGVQHSKSLHSNDQKSEGIKAFHSANAVSRQYTRKEGIAKTLGVLLIPVLAFLTETQLAAYGLEEGGEKTESGSRKEGLNNLVGLLKTWMPFTNEFLGVFNIWGTLIDMIAATAILWNTVDEVQEYGPFSGFLKGVGLNIFSFFGPGWFIPKFQDFVAGIFNQHSQFKDYPMNLDGSKSKKFLGFDKMGRIAAGFASIIILESCVKLWDLYVIPLFEDGVDWLRNKFKSVRTEESTENPTYPQTQQEVLSRIPGILRGAAKRRMNASKKDINGLVF